MTNMPDDNQGLHKSGSTRGDLKKHTKSMQMGNHENMRGVASAKCVDSQIIEDVMHRIFHDCRTKDAVFELKPRKKTFQKKLEQQSLFCANCSGSKHIKML